MAIPCFSKRQTHPDSISESNMVNLIFTRQSQQKNLHSNAATLIIENLPKSHLLHLIENY